MGEEWAYPVLRERDNSPHINHNWDSTMRTDTTNARQPQWSLLTRRLSSLLVAASLAGVMACSSSGGEPTGPNNHDEEGNYALVQVDLVATPATIHAGPWFDAASGTFFNEFIVQVVGGQVKLLEDHRFVMTLDIAMTGDGFPAFTSIQVGGWYEIDGEDIYFEADDETVGDLEGEIEDEMIEVEIDLMGKGANQLRFVK